MNLQDGIARVARLCVAMAKRAARSTHYGHSQFEQRPRTNESVARQD